MNNIKRIVLSLGELKNKSFPYNPGKMMSRLDFYVIMKAPNITL